MGCEKLGPGLGWVPGIGETVSPACAQGPGFTCFALGPAPCYRGSEVLAAEGCRQNWALHTFKSRHDLIQISNKCLEKAGKSQEETA